MSPEGVSGVSSAGADTRALAARINAKVVRRGVSLEVALGESAGDAPQDASLLRALCYGSLRWHHRLQWQADQLLSRPLNRRDADLGALIRIGLYQLQWLRIPDHAAVAATVAAAPMLGKARAKGLVNAVLRRFQREHEQLTQRMGDHPEAASSHPVWLLDRLRQEWPARWQDIVAVNNSQPPMWLRINLRRVSRSQYLDRLAAAGVAVEPAIEPADGPASAVLLSEPQAMRTLPGFEDGLVSVQDGAAQLAVGFLNLEPGQRVLDACAAPGGKSAHVLETCPDIGELVAVDKDPERLEAVAGTFQRLGLAGTLIAGDAVDPGAWWDGAHFDRILLDAPCSALGVIRRHPDIKVLRRPDDVRRSAERQQALLKTLWPLLAPGGRLVYATCTILKEENQDQIQAFLQETPTAAPSETGAGVQRQILPGEANMDGFYYACLDKVG